MPVVDRRVRVLIADMIQSMHREGGIGLAAPQIGIPLRVIVADVGGGPLAVVNPRLRRRAGTEVGIEGCLSIPGTYGEVSRAQRVEVEGQSRWGRRVVVQSRDLLARVFQHEVDHLNGVLFTDPGRLIRRLRRVARRRRTR